MDKPQRQTKDVILIKNGKKPSRSQKKLMAKWKLNPEDWLVCKDTPEAMELVHRHFPAITRTIPKGEA